MKVLQINSVYGIKSTGRIAYEIANLQKENDIEAFIACSLTDVKSPNVLSMSKSTFYEKFNILKTRLFGKHGFYNKSATRRLVKFMDKVKPDVIHLHNIHGHYVNIKMLFDYINKKKIPVVWTLHDCWAFTGHCPHFDYIGCDKWKTGCHNCSQRKGYPGSWFFDRSKGNYKAKKKLFTSVDKMHIVTPSRWLANLTKQSFLGKYPVTVVHNGIDTEAFSPTISDLRKKLGLEDKFIILGIVSGLGGTKGGKYFFELSKLLKDDEHIVLVSWTDNSVKLPSNITAIGRTENARELAKYYSMADVFVNPTLQDTFPTVNIESVSCGTPVVTFDTGGSGESLNTDCSVVVEKGNTAELYKGIEAIRKGANKSDACRKRGVEFTTQKRLSEYIEIYKRILSDR